MKNTLTFLAFLAAATICSYAQPADQEIPFSQCKVLQSNYRDAILDKTVGDVTMTMDELFDGKWMSGYQRFEEVGYRRFGWNSRQSRLWSTFDIGEYAKLSKAVVMPYCGFTQSDPATFEIWAYVGEGAVPQASNPEWFENDPNWVRIARVDASLMYEKVKRFEEDPAGIGDPDVDPCVSGFEFRMGNCCSEIPSARYYRFRLLNNYYGLRRYEYEEFTALYAFTHSCTMSELRLWKSDNPVCSNDWSEPQPPDVEVKARDIVLFYCGSPRDRNKETNPNFLDYLITDEKKPRWLFDSSIFLQLWPDGTYSYMGMGRRTVNGKSVFRLPATKKHIEMLWDDWFKVLIPRLEKNLGEAKQIVKQPFHKHQLSIMLSVLPKHRLADYDWGTLDGRDKMDWNNWEDTKAAYIWQIDNIIEKFNAGGFENIELLGFYWPQEDGGISMWHIKDIADYIHSKGLQLHYIPMYNKAQCVYPLYSTWIESGFDFTYLQPNYFFDAKVPYSRLADACKMAEKYKMNMEMEFSPTSYPKNLVRLEHYMNVFDSCGVFKNTPSIAYYQHFRDFSVLKEAKGKDEYKYSLYKRLSNYIADRHEQFYGPLDKKRPSKKKK